MSEVVLSANKDHMATITLNRPAANNVINNEVAREIERICADINSDDDIHVVILTAAGKRAFCAGSELEQTIQTGKASRVSQGDLSLQHNVAKAVAGIDKPVIAAINGDALGQGLELALSCDIRVAVPGARFGLPQIASGIIPIDGGTQRLPRIVGKSKAIEMILTGEAITAGEALETGLVSKIVATENLLAEVENMAQTMANKAPIALRFIKEAVNKGLDLTLEQGLRLEADLYFLLHTTADRTEGIKAFQQKRTPRFKGK